MDTSRHKLGQRGSFLIFLLLVAFVGWTQGLEAFTNLNDSSDYANDSFVWDKTS